MHTVSLIFSLILLSMATGTNAQVRKCTGADGKVTYSDSLCASQATKEAAVNTTSNTVDARGLRQEAKAMRTDAAVQDALRRDSGQCKFSSYVYGDSKGKTLADAAKAECLDNIAAKASSRPTSTAAYEMWKDHSTQKSADRNASAARAQATANAQAIANSNRQAIDAVGQKLETKTYDCKPVFGQPGNLTCK